MKENCKERVSDQTGWGRSHQCTRKAVSDGYCKQHHPDTIRAKDLERDKKRKEKREQSPYALLQKATQRITELEKELAELKQPVKR